MTKVVIETTRTVISGATALNPASTGYQYKLVENEDGTFSILKSYWRCPNGYANSTVEERSHVQQGPIAFSRLNLNVHRELAALLKPECAGYNPRLAAIIQ